MDAKLALVCLISFVLLTGCNGEPAEPEVEVPETDAGMVEEESQESGDEEPAGGSEEAEGTEETEETVETGPAAFFMKDGTVKRFRGEGNEYAELTVEVEHLDESHVALYEDNGGTRMLRIFRISDQRIDLVLEQPEFYEVYESDPAKLEVISNYLTFPLEIGQTGRLGEIVHLQGTAETPYRDFEEAVIIESEEQDGAINRVYLVEGYGEVKREFIMEEEGAEFTVTSSLESVE